MNRKCIVCLWISAFVFTLGEATKRTRADERRPTTRLSSPMLGSDTRVLLTKTKTTTTTTQDNGGIETILSSSRGGGAATVTNAPSKSLSEQRRRRMIVWLVGSALMNDSLQVSMLLPMIHSLVTSPPPLGVPDSSAEIAMGIFFAAKDMLQLATAPLAGILVARTSAQRALFLSTAALGGATLVFSQATTFTQLLIARAAQGAASAAVLTGGLSLIATTHPADVRGTAMGLANTGLALGLVTGPLIGGALYAAWGRQRTFLLAGSIVLLNALAQFLFLDQNEAIHTTTRTRKTTKKLTTFAQQSSSSSEWAAMTRLLHNPQILVVAASILAIHAVLGVMKPISQVVLAREFGVDVWERSLVISIATVTYMLSTPLAGRLSDVLPSRSSMVVLGLALMSLSAVFFGLRVVGGLPALYMSVALLGTALGVSSSASQALLADLVDRQDNHGSSNRHGGGTGSSGDYSMAFALSDMADSIGMIVGPVLGLAMSQSYGPTMGVASIALGCLVLIPFVARV